MDIVSPHTQNNSTTFIYCLRDPETQLIRYVGKANDPQIRLVRHLREKYKSYKNAWLTSLKARGLVPELEIIEEVLVSQWQTRERYWIAYYREQGVPLTNDTDGGDGVHGRKRTLEEKARIGAASKGNQYGKGHKPTPQTTAKRSASLKGHLVSPVTAEKIAASKRGKSPSDETRAKISATLTGRPLSETTVAKLRGRTISEEHKKKISMAHRGKEVSESTREKLRGRKMSEENKARLIEINKNRVHTDEERTANRERALRLGLKPPSRKGIPTLPETIAKRNATLATKNYDKRQEKHILGEALRSDRNSGMTYSQLAKKYTIGESQVGRVVKGESWK